MPIQPPILDPNSGDMYAPTWAGLYKQIPGYCDVDFDYPCGAEGLPTSITLQPGQTSLKNPVAIDSDADYLAREIYVAPIGGSTVGDSSEINPQDLKIRITDGDGNAITSDWCTANDLCQGVGPVPLPLRKGTVVFVDLWNQGDGVLVVQMGFKGWKRFPCSDKQAEVNPFLTQRAAFCKPWPGVRFEDYEYFWEFSNGASALFPPWVSNLQPTSPNGEFRQFTLALDQDAGFLWRGTTGMIMRTGGPVPQAPEQFFITFYDNALVPLAKLVPRAGAVPQTPGPGCELVLSDGGGRMAPHFPEIWIPAGGTLAVDVTLQIPEGVTVSFSLRGVKVYDLAACRA